jgi:hypothetical protein
MISVEKAQELLRNMQEDVTENHGMAEGQELSWRVEGAGSGHSHRYYVVKGYGKTGKGWDKMWKGQHGTGDFVSKERAEQKAEELNQNLRDNKK